MRAPLHVTSAANPRLKEIAALGVKKNRAESGLFMAEGLEFLSFALEAGWVPETVVFVEGEKDVRLKALLEAAKHTMSVPDYLMEKLARKDNAQSVLATFKQRIMKLDKALPQAGEVWLALDRVRDPGNLGTILRTCDAAGVSSLILLDECTDPFGPECVRATMGSIFHVPVFAGTTQDFAVWRKGFGGAVYGTHLQGAVDFRTLGQKSNAPRLVLMGNESDGLPEALVKLCTEKVRIPMMGKLESLNLATATAVMLYELRRGDF